MTQRFQFGLRALLVAMLAITGIVGAIVLVLLVADMVRLAANLDVGRPGPRQVVLARLPGSDLVLAEVTILAAGLAALFVVIKLWQYQRRPSKK
jgi:hypothetical protein